MNAIELLEIQHRDVDSLFDQVVGKNPPPERKLELFHRIADLLAIHATLEELHFYPAVKAASTEEILEESLEEHLQVKRLISDLLLLAVDDDKFDAKLQVLSEEVRHHVEEERDELFPKVRELLDGDQLEAIGQLMTSTMVELEKGPPPRLDVPAQTLAAPPLVGYTGERGGHLASRLFPRLARFLTVPMELASIVKSTIERVRERLPRQRREA